MKVSLVHKVNIFNLIKPTYDSIRVWKKTSYWQNLFAFIIVMTNVFIQSEANV